MPSIDPTTLTADQLAPMLRAWAAGDRATEAAVDLLIAHRTWLTRPDFRARLIDAIDDGWAAGGALAPMASIDWPNVEAFLADHQQAASTSDVRILRLAASLAGTAPTTSLRELTAGMGTVHARLLLEALAHRLGWHEQGMAEAGPRHLAPPAAEPPEFTSPAGAPGSEASVPPPATEPSAHEAPELPPASEVPNREAPELPAHAETPEAQPPGEGRTR